MTGSVAMVHTMLYGAVIAVVPPVAPTHSGCVVTSSCGAPDMGENGHEMIIDGARNIELCFEGQNPEGKTLRLPAYLHGFPHLRWDFNRIEDLLLG